MKTALAVGLAFALTACSTTVIPRQPRVLTVPGVVGNDIQLEIVDETGELVDARAISGEELGGTPMPLEGQIVAWAGPTPNEVRLVWISFACETAGRLTISNPNKVTITPGPMADCHAIGNHRAVDLVFRGPVNAPALQVDLRPHPTEGDG